MAQTLLRDEAFTAQVLEWTTRPNPAIGTTIPFNSNCAATLKRPLRSTTQLELKGVIADCDANIATIDAIVSALLEKKQTFHHFSTTYKPLVAAHRRMPQEILQEIFMHSLKPSNSGECIASNMRTALRVSWVSTSWRHAAISKPSLWSAIQILGKGKCSLLSLFLRRSQSQSLFIDIAAKDNANADADYAEEVKLIMPYCSRWRLLRLNVPPKSLECLEAAKNKMSRLEWVAFRSMVDPPICFMNAPKLREIDLLWGSNISSSNMEHPSDRVPWAQLTTCYAGRCDAYDAVELLRECGNLVAFDCSIVSPLNQPIVTLVTSGALEVLRVTADAECFGFYENIACPSLTTLRHCDDGIVTSSQVFTAFLERSKCAVQTLHLNMCWDLLWESSEWIDVLEMVPSLTTLIVPSQTMTVFRMPEAFARVNYPSPLGKTLLPHLETLVVSIESIDYSFVEMIQGRQSGTGSTFGPDSHLRSLYLDSVNDADEGALELLHRMKDDGLRVSILGSLQLDPKFAFEEVDWDTRDSEYIGEPFY